MTIRPYQQAFIIESTSPLLATDSGAGHQFRLDLIDARPSEAPTIPLGRSQIPNKLAPPLVPLIQARPSPSNVKPPAKIQEPEMSTYLHPLEASPKGALTSYWQCVPIEDDKYQGKYLLFNPTSGTYAGQIPLSSPATNTSVVDDVAPNGSPIQAVDLKQYLTDMSAWLAVEKTINVKTVVARVAAHLEYFTWTLQRSDLGPVPGLC